MTTVPWNEVKWARANAQLGLKRDEICPGLTLDQHAESLAMFEMRDVNVENKTWALSVTVMAALLKKRLLGGITEEEIESY